jgi:hypothetical protein
MESLELSRRCFPRAVAVATFPPSPDMKKAARARARTAYRQAVVVAASLAARSSRAFCRRRSLTAFNPA